MIGLLFVVISKHLGVPVVLIEYRYCISLSSVQLNCASFPSKLFFYGLRGKHYRPFPKVIWIWLVYCLNLVIRAIIGQPHLLLECGVNERRIRESTLGNVSPVTFDIKEQLSVSSSPIPGAYVLPAVPAPWFCLFDF